MTRITFPLLATLLATACGPTGVTISVSADQTATVPATGHDTTKLTATVGDGAGKPVDVQSVTFTATGTGNGTLNAIKQSTGLFTADFSSTKAEKKSVTVSATVGGVTVTSTPLDVTFVGGPASQLSFVVQPTTVRAGALITPAPAVLVTDQNGNPTTDTASFSVRMVRTNAGVLSGGTAKPLVDGLVTFDMLSVNHVETGAALRAEGPGGLAAESSLFDVTAGDPSQVTSTLLASPVNVTVGSTSTLTVTVLDLGANPLSGLNVVLSVDGTGNSLGATSGTTDAGGVFTTTLGSTVAESKHVTATVGPLTLTTTVTFIP